MTVPNAVPKPDPALILEDFREFVRARPCAICLQSGRMRYGCEAAHVRTRRNNGDRANLYPACAGLDGHHAEQHRMGVTSFSNKYKVDLRVLADGYWHAWLDERGY